MKEKQSDNPVERKTNRYLLVAYDLIVFSIAVVLVLALRPFQRNMNPSGTAIWLNFLISGALIFTARFLFRVYKQIWRLNQVRAFARLIAADLIGGGCYLLLVFLLRQFSETFREIGLFSAAALVAMDLVALLVFRIAYYYLYLYAKSDHLLTGFVKKCIRIFGLVDFDSLEAGGRLQIALEPARRADEPIGEVQRIARQFAIRGEVTSVEQITKGYINRTYRIETKSDTGNTHRYILQRINTNVFPDADALMENYTHVTNFLAGRLLLPGRGERGSVAAIRPTKDGRAYYRDDTGCWRMTVCFENVYSMDIPDRPDTFYYAGRSFGEFIVQMADFDPQKIHEVIPNFHNTESRYRDLEKVIEKDPVGRVKDVQKEIEFVRKHHYIYSIISSKLEAGEIPTRICHNDCNLNNILFDRDTHLPVALIDLDTVMPSSALYDYGDSMRIGTNTAKDDEKDLSKVSCNLQLYRQYAKGFLESCGNRLTKEELNLLPYASLVITSEDGIRFLMDHIDGDTYYNIYYPGQNLDRSRTQLKLLEDMEKKLPEIKKILREIYTELGLVDENFDFTDPMPRA